MTASYTIVQMSVTAGMSLPPMKRDEVQFKDWYAAVWHPVGCITVAYTVAAEIFSELRRDARVGQLRAGFCVVYMSLTTL